MATDRNRRRARSGVVLGLLLALGIVVLPGCAGWLRSPQSVPAWVLDPPTVSGGKVYALGVVGRSLFPGWARRNAAEQARAELSLVLKVRVQTAWLEISKDNGQRSQTRAALVTAYANDVVLTGSYIVGCWTDVLGRVPGGEVGATYALAVLDLSTPGAPSVTLPEGLSAADADAVLHRAAEAR
jgi:hypothetical protein